MELVYLDNNATTRLAAEVLEAMMPYLGEVYGNPNSVHRFGQRARQAIDEARTRVGQLVGCADSEVIFTSGGTESVNMAIRGILAARSPRRKILTSAVEHSATRELCRELGKQGCDVVEIGVDSTGALDLDQLTKSLDDGVGLVSIMWANNETGVVFPIEKIAGLCREKGVPFHCDGTQAIGKITVDVKAAGVDAMSFAAHKFHGPKGVGGLYVRRGLRIRPLVIGGPQENKRRGGTENVAGIVGMGRAAELAGQHLADMPRVAGLRDRLEQGIFREIPETSVNGGREARVPNTTNISFARLAAEAILLLLSEQGICASAGAACASGSLEPSHVIRAMKIPDRLASGAVRFSLSRYATDEEIARALAVLPPIIARLRAVLPVGAQ